MVFTASVTYIDSIVGIVIQADLTRRPLRQRFGERLTVLDEGLVREHRHAQSEYPLVRQPRLCEVRKGIRSSNSSLRFRLKSSPSPFLFRARTVERGFVAQVLPLISRSLLRRSWHLPRGLTISLAGCRGFTGPVPPPLSMSAAGRPACLAGNYITSGRRMQGPPARAAFPKVRFGPPTERSWLRLLGALGVPFAAGGGGAEHLLLESLHEACKERGYLKVRGRQRTDSTHVLGALRVLSTW